MAEALRAERPLVELLVAEGAGLDELRAQALAQGLRVRREERAVLDGLTEGLVHQGVVAVAKEFPYTTVARAAGGTDLVVVLDGITDPQNLGAIARSAEAAGAGALILPRRRSAHVTPAAEKAAAGAFSWLRVGLAANVERALAELADLGFWSVGLAGDAPETLWSSALLEGQVALVLGSEGRGLSRLVRERVDGLAGIPMQGRVGSLNASAAAAVALFEVRRRRETGVR